MNTYITAYPVHSFGRWLAALAISLVLLALAYAQAPDPAGQLGLQPATTRPLARGTHYTPSPGQALTAQALASSQPSLPAGVASHAQFAR